LNNADCFERSLWDSIERYYNNPIGNRKPNIDETPDDFEMSIVQGTLTPDQRISWLYALKEQKQIEAETALILQAENKTKAIELQQDGKGLMDIAKELNVPLADVVKWTTAND
jgi:hypothetical protein